MPSARNAVHPRIIKLTRQPDHYRASANDQDRFKVGAFGNGFLFPCFGSPLAKSPPERVARWKWPLKAVAIGAFLKGARVGRAALAVQLVARLGCMPLLECTVFGLVTQGPVSRPKWCIRI
jgi:hypothetical protein